MEIERKFLIQEKEKTFYSPIEINLLRKDIKKNGIKIEQYYLPINQLEKILKQFEIKLKFEPNEIRIRKIDNKFILTFKSKGSEKRHEFEKTISSEDFENLKKTASKKIEKIRLAKNIQHQIIDFNYFPEQSLIIAEVEFKNLYESKKFKTYMKEITGVDKYKNRNIAKNII